MRKIIYKKIDTHNIPSLPRVIFEGKIIEVISEEKVKDAVDYLLAEDVLGIDTETRPAFKKGKSYLVSLLQVSSKDTCYLFRLNQTGTTPDIIRLLEDTRVPKIGLSLHDDILALHKRSDFKPGYFIDLQNVVKEFGIEDLSLTKLYANLFGQKISKRERLTNWDAEELTDKQKKYAATDAWTCIKLYEELKRLKKDNDYDIVSVDELKSDETEG